MQLWQSLVDRWSRLVFRERHPEITPKIRVLRVLEEALELAQAEGVTTSEAITIVDQVFSKPKGYAHQELGGVLITLAGYADTANDDLESAFWAEFRRIMDPEIMEKVRIRNLAGDKIGFERKLTNDELYEELRLLNDCPVCGQQQFNTPSGVTCPNGHGF
jgi:NTP pyrophosphatase (non-canonical NTP hydrolase)